MDITRTRAWHDLRDHHREVAPRHLRDMFATDPDRSTRFSLQVGDLFIDYSKQRIEPRTIELLAALAGEAGLESAVAAMFRGDRINTTEDRAVLHTALRGGAGRSVCVDGTDVMPAVETVRARMRRFVAAVRDGTWRGFGGARISDVVNIGIGGSHLGPHMAATALADGSGIRTHFVANVDDADIRGTLAALDPETTLFVVVSKTFTTQETTANAEVARDWLRRHFVDSAAVARHFVAVSTNLPAVRAFGIDPGNAFEMWDWVGGRYSLWSAVGLTLALAIGMDGFEEMLAGARAIDDHFRTTPFTANAPALLALIGVWYHNFFGAESHCVVPYEEGLRFLPAYLQQLDMESNGKRVRRDGSPVAATTGPIVWGGTGTNSQHAFFQLLHQGGRLIPVDFLLGREGRYGAGPLHDMLAANCFAQAEALMRGRSADETAAGMRASGIPADRVEALTPHRTFPGNNPSTTILYSRLTPRVLGQLLTLYEHKVFVQGIIWGINSFDQWGVELGKQLAGTILGELQGGPRQAHDASTAELIARYRAS